MRQISHSSRFRKSLQRMPKHVQGAFLAKESLFLQKPFHPLLETHKLHGKYKEYRAFSVIGQYRVMFKFVDNERDVGFINIGTHEIYK